MLRWSRCLKIARAMAKARTGRDIQLPGATAQGRFRLPPLNKKSGEGKTPAVKSAIRRSSKTNQR